jgi:hypothetical protein
MHNHAPKQSEPQVQIPGDSQTIDKTCLLPPTLRLGLDPEESGRIALRSGFMKRRPRKIEPSSFLQALVFMSVMPIFSMRALVIHLGMLTHNVISSERGHSIFFIVSCFRTAPTLLFLQSLPLFFQAPRIGRVKSALQLNFRTLTALSPKHLSLFRSLLSGANAGFWGNT